MASWLRFLGLGRGSSREATPPTSPGLAIDPPLPPELLAIPGARTLPSLLEPWRWLGVGDMTVLAATITGDLLLEDGAGAVLLLESSDGRVIPLAPSREAFANAAALPAHREQWLSASFAAACRGAGLVPGPGQCLSFEVPLVIGGAQEIENVKVADLLLHHHVLGQVHEQVRALPPGTVISGIQLVE
jgi:hypothetical protein